MKCTCNANDSIYITLKPILHYAFGLRFGNVCEYKREKNARKTREKREKNARKTREKREKNARKTREKREKNARKMQMARDFNQRIEGRPKKNGDVSRV